LTGDDIALMVLAYDLHRYGHDDFLLLEGGLERWKEGRKSADLLNTMRPLRNEERPLV
jgi:3-mercaptopyruvate sulfurtransferase SseA